MNRGDYIREELERKKPLMAEALAKEADPFQRFIIEMIYGTAEGTEGRHDLLRTWCGKQTTPLHYEQAEVILRWCGSFDIARALESLAQCMDRDSWWRLFGKNWSHCDDGAHIRDFLEAQLSEATLDELRLAMSEDELEALDKLPNSVTVYRGCYEHNANGLSWSLSRDIAARFPSLRRYRVDGEQPILVTGTAWKGSMILKLGRKEQEVLSGSVWYESQEDLQVTTDA